jgi:uncharacterized lipoprotein
LSDPFRIDRAARVAGLRIVIPFQESNMKSTFRTTTPLVAGLIAVALVSASGCSWFRSHNDYSRTAENRPLEVPPDLDRPETANSLPLPSAQGLGGTAASPVGFVVADSPANVFARLGTVLATIEGVTVTGKAESLGSYDVAYQGQNFLVRVEETGGQSRISAISASGQLLRAGPAAVLLEKLRPKL